MSIYIPAKEQNNSDRLSLYKKLPDGIKIIKDGKLNMRCNSFRFMNDPRERMAWTFRTHQNFENEILKHEAKFSELIKARLGLLCFAMDDPNINNKNESCPRADYYYGYHRPRMWAQYAENHQGVCLVFNKTKLLKCMEEALEPYGTLYHGQIDYFDGDTTPGHLPGEIDDDVTELLKRQDFETLEEQMFYDNKRIQAYLFSKHGDWRDEAEYRFVFKKRQNSEGDEFPISCREALEGVILGYACPNLSYPKSHQFADDERFMRSGRETEYKEFIHNIQSDNKLYIEKVRWTNGYPGQDPIFALQRNSGEGGHE